MSFTELTVSSGRGYCGQRRDRGTAKGDTREETVSGRPEKLISRQINKTALTQEKFYRACNE